jgi:hypothetical protein
VLSTNYPGLIDIKEEASAPVKKPDVSVVKRLRVLEKPETDFDVIEKNFSYALPDSPLKRIAGLLRHVS